MQTLLLRKLHSYIIHNNPEILLRLEEDFSVTSYLESKVAGVLDLLQSLLAEGKPAYIIEELCTNAMTADLRPSKANYLKELLSEEFEAEYERMRESGTLTYETVNLISICMPVFAAFDFSEENEDNRLLRYTLVGMVHDYLKES